MAPHVIPTTVVLCGAAAFLLLPLAAPLTGVATVIAAPAGVAALTLLATYLAATRRNATP
ncbi:hypothetical protein [Embleya sp. NPDC059237]|uniref:hypothetical protein n=1 Tax=Embleya sp. NPDC059237 TaxID=3346784 RepID=UPI00368A7039